MAGPGATRWTRRLGVIAVLLLCMAVRVTAVRLGRLTETDLETFFVPSAKLALAGHPLQIYSVRSGIYPNANGPLGILPLTAVAALGDKLGILDDRLGFRVLMAIVFAVFPLLLAREAVLSLELMRGRRLRDLHRFLVYGLFALGPEAILNKGHPEQPLLLFLLLWSARSLMLGRHTRAGLLLGAALLTRSATLLYLPPLVLLLLFDRKLREAIQLGGAALLTLGLGLLPFALADRANLMYSLFTSHSLLPSTGGSFWGLFAPGSTIWAIGHLHDSQLALAASVLLAVLLLRRVPDLRPGSGSSYALLAICGLCFPLLMKSVWAYYYADAFVLLTIFWLSGAPREADPPALRRWLLGAVVPLSPLMTSVLMTNVLRVYGRRWLPAWSLTLSLATLAVMAVAAAALVRRSRRPDPAVAVRHGAALS